MTDKLLDDWSNLLACVLTISFLLLTLIIVVVLCYCNSFIENFKRSQTGELRMTKWRSCDIEKNRVGSHMVLFGYTVQKNVQLLFYNDVLSETKLRFLHVFSSLYPENYTPFSSPHFSRSNDARISSFYFVNRLCHKMFNGETSLNYRNCTDDNNFLCDRVCTQSKKLKEDILVVFDRENCGLINCV